MVTRQLQVECRTGKDRWSKTTFYHCTTQPTYICASHPTYVRYSSKWAVQFQLKLGNISSVLVFLVLVYFYNNIASVIAFQLHFHSRYSCSMSKAICCHILYYAFALENKRQNTIGETTLTVTLALKTEMVRQNGQNMAISGINYSRTCLYFNENTQTSI